MLVIPAVDILGGKCVRLVQGDPKRSKVYYEDPLEAAQLLEDQGTELIHLIDLSLRPDFKAHLSVVNYYKFVVKVKPMLNLVVTHT